MPDDGVPLRHALHADREHGCHDGGKPFGNRRDGQRDAEDEHIEQCPNTTHILDHHDGDDHDDRDRDDDKTQHLAGAIQFPLQRCRLVGRRLEQSGNAPHLGAHASGGDDSLPVPVGRGRAAEYHVVPIAERHLVWNRSGIFRDGQALAGECRLGRL